MIVALFLPYYLAPFLHAFLPYFCLLWYKKNVKGKNVHYIERKKRRKKKKIVRNNARASTCPPQMQPCKSWPLFQVITHCKKSELMDVLVAWHQQEHQAKEG